MTDINLPAPAPARLAHVALRTNQLEALVRWYCEVLGARVAHASSRVAFLTYDQEHHRIALLALEPYGDKSPSPVLGHAHTAFAYNTLADLLGNWERLQRAGIEPVRAINHGPTVSLYYADPDGNQVELQVDSFPDAEATNAWMQSDAFRSNPIGIEFKPEEMRDRLRAGAPEVELMRRPDALSRN